jgi:hypothetical protein
MFDNLNALREIEYFSILNQEYAKNWEETYHGGSECF